MSAVGSSVISVTCEQRVYPPYDALHGTPHAMLLRRVSIDTPKGKAALEQTDYGHPGRLNAWEPRGVSPALAPRLTELSALADAVASLHEKPGNL